MPASPRLLLIRRRYLGDIVLLGSLCRNLKLHWPDAHLTVLCEPAYAGVTALNPDVAETWPFPTGPAAWAKLLWRLRRAGFTHVLDLDNRDKTAFLTRATGAPVRATVRHGEPVHFPSFYTQHEEVPGDYFAERHITDLYLHPLAGLGVPVATREVRLTPRAVDVENGRRLLARLTPEGAPARRILVHPGSRSAWRIWPAENFAAVIDRLQREHGLGVVLVAGPGEQATVDAICRNLQTPVGRLTETLTVPQLAGLFAAADALLCHDSGPMHLAAAVGTRVIALFGSQPRNIWQPAGARHVTLQAPLPCAHCVSPGQCTPGDSYHNHCVRNIPTDEVLAAITGALERG